MSLRRNVGKQENIKVFAKNGKVVMQRGATTGNEMPPETARQLAAILITAAEMADKAIDWE